MKHIKLFENWAEELKVPEYLDPTIETILYEKRNTQTLFHPYIQKMIETEELELEPNSPVHLNLLSFSEYDKWNEYTKILLDQRYSKYKLKDCFGIPSDYTDVLILRNNDIKTMNGLQKDVFRMFSLTSCNIENLKYVPDSDVYDFSSTPLLSYYGLPDIDFQWGDETYDTSVVENTRCGRLYMRYFKSHSSDTIRIDGTDINFNAEVFCLFSKDDGYYTPNADYKKINPWKRCYYDPNDVENYEFLFNPFWNNSEKFREKVQEYIDDIDLGKLSKEELW